MHLTNDADKLIAIIYKEYLFRRKNDISKFRAIEFSKDQIMSLPKLPSSNESDIEDFLSELHNQDLIDMDLGYDFTLTNEGIIYLEKRFKNNLTEITDFIAKFIP